MEGDLKNLVPVVGEINASRGSLQFGELSSHIPSYGSCEFFKGGSPAVVEPRDEIKGTIARVYQYMVEKYEIDIPKSQQALFQRWSVEYPPQEWELHWVESLGNLG